MVCGGTVEVNIWIKGLVYLVAFSIFHFGYELVPLPILKPFCGVNESVFQHLKMAFWGYLTTSIIEYFVSKKKPASRDRFWYSRLFATSVVPYFTMIYWYLGPALFGRFQNLVSDLIWAIFSTYAAALTAGAVEHSIENAPLNGTFRAFVIILLIVSAFSFIWFTYKLPWIDLFVNPETL